MIDKDILETFRDKVKAAARELGMECPKMNMTYAEHGFSFRGDVYDGAAGYREEFDRVAERKGFPKAWFHQVFSTKNGTYKITGAAMRGRSYPILAVKLSDNTKYKFSIQAVRKGNPLNVVQSQDLVE